jgi:hypothetical protein
MLTISGSGSRFCDQRTRRSFLQIGGLGLGGLSLAEILKAESGAPSAAATERRAKGIIMVLLPGGPSHLDTFDCKPDAPAEVRGEFQPIPTNVSGFDICELMPQLARVADKMSLIRSLVGFQDDHNTHWCTTGWESHPAMESSPIIAGFPPGDWPSMGSILSRQLGTRVSGVPAAVDLTPIAPDARFILRTPPTQPGYLGTAHAGFEVEAVDRRNIRLNGTTLERVGDRQALLASFDRFRREVDRGVASDGMTDFHRQALDVLASPRLAEALDLSRESERVRSRYGLTRSFPNEREGKTYLDQFLLARRVIEAGARCVTLAFCRWPFGRMLRGDYNWDWHKDLFNEARGALPLLDLGLSALIEDLDQCGMLDDVAVVVWGEFGRTPKINSAAGRDHWPRVCSALVAGGGMRSGQVIGSTTRWGEEPLTRPVHFREVFATLYQRLGIDVATTQFFDRSGRPQFLVGEHRPMQELLS